MALTDSQQRELTRRYMRRLDTLSLAGGTALANAWLQMRGLDDSDIEELRRLAEQAVTGINQQAAATSAGFLGLLLDEPVIAADKVVEPEWRAPFTHAWGALGRGEDLDQAVEAGRARADAAGRNAVVSTARRVGDQLGSDRVGGWRRVLWGKSCHWCETVAQQTYHSASSADFGHDRCNCGVSPILR